MEPIFSIIVPVYNVEKYLEQCLESILRQTCIRYEVLLIDDGSTDHSGEICDAYAAKYEKFTVIHQQNRGLSSARNVGLEHAVGRYIVFMDSDDMIEKELLLKVYTQLEERNFDICSFAARKITEDGQTLYEMRFDQMITELELTEENRYHFLYRHFLQYETGWEVCFHIFRRDIIEANHISFQEQLKYAEDIPFTFEYLLHVDHWVKIPDILYLYRTQSESITQTKQLNVMIRGVLVEDYRVMADRLRKCGEPEILLYAALIHYFVPQYLLETDMESIRQILVQDSASMEQWKRVLKNKQKLIKEFGKEMTGTICQIMRYFVKGRA